jgi:hypothetical protein
VREIGRYGRVSALLLSSTNPDRHPEVRHHPDGSCGSLTPPAIARVTKDT